MAAILSIETALTSRRSETYIGGSQLSCKYTRRSESMSYIPKERERERKKKEEKSNTYVHSSWERGVRVHLTQISKY